VFPSSEIRVLENANDRLVIIDPAFFPAGALILIFVLIAGVTPFAFRRSPQRGFVLWTTVSVVIVGALIGVALLTSQSTITFDGSTNTVSIVRQTFWFQRTKPGPHLSEISAAAVVAGKGTQKGLHYLCVLLWSGEIVRLGNLTSQSGHYAVADAINEFLRNRPRRSSETYTR
jgi:hypothetical protein